MTDDIDYHLALLALRSRCLELAESWDKEAAQIGCLFRSQGGDSRFKRYTGLRVLDFKVHAARLRELLND